MTRVQLRHDFWRQRLEVNAQQAIFHQWEQLEASGCIENFRIAAGISDGFREGWFFADSDAYKWLEAAVRIQAAFPNTRLATLIDDFIDLIERTQATDGYLYTYNQIFFPDTRWQNLQIEHELYCLGHLIEAGVSHYESTGNTQLLDICRKAANRIVEDFRGKDAGYTPGHEEIEIALLGLHQATQGDKDFLEMARQFIEQRGRSKDFAFALLRQNIRVGARDKFVRQKKQAYQAAHPDFKPFTLPPGNLAKKSWNSTLRWYASVLSGKYFQQHAPVREQTIPVGHSVRFAYLETAVAMLARLNGDRTLIPVLKQAWEHMVSRRMYITGGIGSVPSLEGFGRDYELNPQYAYTETCAALGSLFWNWEMVQLTGEAKYSDLFEWQLYNAVSVGMGLDGNTYLYNNPLVSHGEVARQPWYAIPCCPSNISRTYANIGKYIFSTQAGELYIHQYLPCAPRKQTIQLKDGGTATLSLQIESNLPWEGRVRIKIMDILNANGNQASEFDVLLRQPSWCEEMRIDIINSVVVNTPLTRREPNNTASGYDPGSAVFRRIHHSWAPGDELAIDFDLPVHICRAHDKVKGHHDKAAITRGPLVYCLEGVDNPGVDIFTARLDLDSLEAVYDDELLGGIVKLMGKTVDGTPLMFIPYFLWGNRGLSHMTVWVCI
ncbi:MAG: glycoside hydrolase family 127 protein [Anaerolineales bacterium]|nr:glycoside hydrolase family 127 protein [Anaerolineales bacterium]